MTIDQLFLFIKISLWTLLLGSVAIPIWAILTPSEIVARIHVILRALLAIGIVYGLATAYHHFGTRSVYSSFSEENPGCLVCWPGVSILWDAPRIVLALTAVVSLCVLILRGISQSETKIRQNKPAMDKPDPVVS
jgi:hypothetical protein